MLILGQREPLLKKTGLNNTLKRMVQYGSKNVSVLQVCAQNIHTVKHVWQ